MLAIKKKEKLEGMQRGAVLGAEQHLGALVSRVLGTSRESDGSQLYFFEDERLLLEVHGASATGLVNESEVEFIDFLAAVLRLWHRVMIW